MKQSRNRFKLLLLLSISLAVFLSLIGCNRASETTPSASMVKKMPDQMTKVKIATSSLNINLLPWYIAQEKGIFKKYNLDVELQRVEGDVIGLRGLQSNDFAFIASLPESIITGVSEGANIKLIGTLTAQSMYSIFVTPDIQKVEDLKGKTASSLQLGSGNDVVLRYLLKKHGLEPEKDVKIIFAGGNSSRMQALIAGQAQVTLLSPPTDLKAEAAGLKKIGLVRDELKSYNHDTISASGKVLNETPELARAFMAATAEAIDFTKNEANRTQLIQIGTKVLETNEEDFLKTLEFALPSYGDKGKLNLEGIQWAIDTAKQTGTLRNDIKVEDVVDERYYVE